MSSSGIELSGLLHSALNNYVTPAPPPRGMLGENDKSYNLHGASGACIYLNNIENVRMNLIATRFEVQISSYS
jgi:hypothetical protein